MSVKAVIVAAGYGTRFLPLARVVPKELLPIGTRPALDLVVSELVDAGIDEIVVITSRRKRGIEDWFDRDPELEAVFAREGATDKLAKIRPPDVKVSFVRQPEMRGTGHALLLARPFIGDAPFVVAYPDDLFGSPNCSAELVETWRRTGGSVLSAMQLGPDEDPSRYGVLDVDGELRVRELVEKPAPGTEPSRLVSLGRYLFTPDLFDELEKGAREHGAGEFYHVGAVNALAARGRVSARVVSGKRYDTGTPLGYLQAVVEFGMEDPKGGAEFRAWLEKRSKT